MRCILPVTWQVRFAPCKDDLRQNGAHDDDYNIPYTTLHVGRIDGGVQLNIVPHEAVIDFEIRNLAEDNPAGHHPNNRAQNSANYCQSTADRPGSGDQFHDYQHLSRAEYRCK